MEKVKQVHSAGGYGSQGYRYDWKIEEASKNVLRTHTTAVSARMLHKLMQQVCVLTPRPLSPTSTVFFITAQFCFDTISGGIQTSQVLQH